MRVPQSASIIAGEGGHTSMRKRLRGLYAAIAVLFRKYLVAGIITVIPIWVTWLLVDFLFRILSAQGHIIRRR